MSLHAPSPKRLRASVACDQCKASKKQCRQGIPCANCTRRRIACTFNSSTADAALDGQTLVDRKCALDLPAGLATAFPSTDGRLSSATGFTTNYSLDLPQPLQASLVPLVDWYFDVIAPHWPVVERTDFIGRTPFAAPLLTRAVCLVAAMTGPHVDDGLVSSIVESVRQCFDAHDLCARPSLSTLQALLLLLCCPALADLQAPVMTTAACTMAIALGLHRPQAPRPVLYWSCIAWARWDALSTSRATGRDAPLCFDLESAVPATRPDPATCFGAIYRLLEGQQLQQPQQEQAQPPAMRVLIHAAQLHLSAPQMGPHPADIRAQLLSEFPLFANDKALEKAFSINPFASMLRPPD
ncbi:hypothetical protein SEUCBS140593_002274 [Sporothrix eucalyptigena]|uniref:Zn(2)-C6 fungal-type domain-containing protein n=1 Tax=Sporothrix eucalyptigena TaxID=1812306 RepID=A0ABP0B5A2_9PEZI